MSFFPEWPIFVQFALISLILALIPGPDMMLSVGRTIAQNKKAGIMCAFGSATGFAIQVTAVAIGLSALIVTSPRAFFLLRIVGAFFLLWLAFQTLLKNSTFSLQQTSPPKHQSLKRNYLAGVGINLLNPKVILFNMTFLPQFIDVNDPMVKQKLFILGLSYIPISLPITILLVLMANKFSTSLKENPFYIRMLNWLIAAIFIIFALRLLIIKAH
ncbi:MULTISPECIES: LysE family translocator [Bartonella]|uniref:Amino acid efflux protein n=2 Tax=Bartonella schoenbuchensis TaxID=165694 RepID=E6YXF9_BARSR|nr:MULTISPECIES: LysE family translocator [Bartonella]AQX29978.1 Threonine/homoserine/homoserine lactone efflux protein [Bartonella schoenbuchensis R1]CBI81547.1 amino acid efflux protein [Bartonella schoenbuchensis R1]CDP79255.1 amino acid efflux protein, LysE family [Bartonella schoenbuchensis]